MVVFKPRRSAWCTGDVHWLSQLIIEVRRLRIAVPMMMARILLQVLTALDAKLDGVINTAAGVAGAPVAFLSGGNGGKRHDMGSSGAELDHVVAAKNAYLRTIEDAVLLVKVHHNRIPLADLRQRSGM